MSSNVVTFSMNSSRRRNYSRKKFKKHANKNLFLIIITAVILFLLGISGFLNFLSKNIMLILVLIIIAAIGYLFFLFKAGNFSNNLSENNYKNFNTEPSLNRMRSMDPFDFEHYVASIFESYGYNTRVTIRSADHGVDVWMEKDKRIYAVQVKRYSAKNYVGAKELRDFYGSFVDYPNTTGWFISTGFFSKQSKEWASTRKRLRLIEGEEFAKIVSGIN